MEMRLDETFPRPLLNWMPDSTHCLRNTMNYFQPFSAKQIVKKVQTKTKTTVSSGLQSRLRQLSSDQIYGTKPYLMTQILNMSTWTSSSPITASPWTATHKPAPATPPPSPLEDKPPTPPPYRTCPYRAAPSQGVCHHAAPLRPPS
uniref:Uncharacterized protein n=1 Tax=Cacopsylla melanoneura TaxID=428564 RepID=A0A8D8RIN5_9HEMI